MHATHDVLNQPEPLVGHDLFAGNQPLRDALAFNAPRLDTAPLAALGRLAGSAQMQEHARLANVHTPQLRTHDRFGHRIDDPYPYFTTVVAACYAQSGRDDEAKHAVARFEDRRPPWFDLPGLVETICGMCRLPDDRAHWVEGFRKAGLIP